MTVEVLLVSPDETEAALIREICEEFECGYSVCKDIDGLLSLPSGVAFVVLSFKAIPEQASLSELVQAARQTAPEAFIALVVADSLGKDEASYLRKCGANFVGLESELVGTSKLSFCISQVMRASYLPVKTTDLAPVDELPFTLYHLMAMRKKFVPLIPMGGPLSGDKLVRLRQNSEYYVRRGDGFSFKNYVDTHADNSAEGLAKRCRANFLALQAEFGALVYPLTNETEHASFGEGQELVGRCRKLCEDLLGNLAEFPQAWEIINSSAIGEFGSLERAPAVACYTGLFGLQLGLPKVSELMLVALLSDLGLVCVPPQITRSLRSQRAMSVEEERQLHRVPETSLRAILSRKLSFDEKSRSILVSTYERADGRGYPKGINFEKLSVGAQLVRFAREFDRKTLFRLGAARPKHLEILSAMIKEALPDCCYTKAFLVMAHDGILKAVMESVA